MATYFDSHCHLDFDAFDADRGQVFSRAREAGVQGILNPAIDLENSRKILAMVADNPGIIAAIGVHPNSATTWNENTLGELAELAKNPKVRAIGEIGLDYYRDWAPQDTQREVFRAQLELAQRVRLPVIIHVRNASAEDQRAMKDVLSILETWQNGLPSTNSPVKDRPGVLHSFSGDAASAQRAIALGFYIGITGPITYKNAQELQQVVSELPLDSLLIETDAPFLTPHPFRGKRNEPAYVRLVADKIAVIHNLEPERVAEMTTSNSERLFNWRVNH